jgi:hypothetical protein
LLALLGSFAFFGQVLLGQRHFVLPADTTDLIFPLESAISRAFSSGDLPLWLPENMAGFSLVSYAQYGLFYPLNWLFWLIPWPDGQFPVEAYHLKVILHVALAAVGTVFLCRQLGRSRTAALVAAATFALTPAALNYVVWGNSQAAFAWWPYCLGWMLHRGAHPLRSHVVAGACLGMSVLASPAQPAIQLLLLICLLTAVRIFADLNPRSSQRAVRAWRDLRNGLVVVGIGLSLGSVTLIPVLVDTSEKVRFLAADGSVLGREKLPFAAFTSIRFDEANLKGFLLPELSHVAVSSNYLGAAAVLLAGFAIVVTFTSAAARTRERAFIVTSLLVSTLYMFGVWLPHVFHLLPGLSLIREPARYSQIFILAGAVLAAVGLDDLRRVRLPWLSRLPALVPVAVMGAAIVGLINLPDIGRERPGVLLIATGAFIAVVMARTAVPLMSVALVGLVVWDMAALGYPSATYAQIDVRHMMEGQQKIARFASSDTDPFRIESMRSGDLRDGPTYLPNAAALVGAEDVWGYHNPVSASALRAYNQSFENPVYLALLNVRWLVTDQSGLTRVEDLVSTGDRVRLRGVPGWTSEMAVQEQNLVAVENRDALGHAWVVYQYRVVPPLTGVPAAGANIDTPPPLVPQRDAVEDPAFDPATTVVLEEDPQLPPAAVPPDSTVTWVERDNDAMTLKVRSSAPGVLVVSDLYDRGWRAEVNGRHAEVLRANWMLNGVRVPAGESTVRLTYRPESLLLALHQRRSLVEEHDPQPQCQAKSRADGERIDHAEWRPGQ